MTNEEYIDFANALKNNYTIDFDKLPEFCDMAISLLPENKGDLISRQAVNEYIDYILGHGMGKKKSFDFIKKFVANLPSGIPQQNKGEWIPIVTRPMTEEEKEEYHGEYDPNDIQMYDCPLPEDGQEVLVTTWLGGVTTDTFYRDDGCYFETFCDDGEVIAWRPLPEPYKAESEDK